ncbi:MAG: PAS domain S-box protein, partial [Nitrospirae bacterium]|nr:PAS domain S-box protein [Nitrospirota bacterium]
MTGQKNPLASRTFLLVLFFILEIFIVLFFYRDYKGHDALYRAQMLQTLETGYRGATTGYDKTTQMIFEEVVNKPEVLKLIASALDDEKKRDTYRNALYRLMLPAYEMQKTIGIWQFHFHLKDGTSFLRMHSSGKYGDNLFRRPAVKLVNTEQKRVTGYEVGHFADGYRFMHPLFYKGRHIGSVEFAITSMGIIDYMNHVSPGQYYFIINRGIVDEMTYEDWKKINFKVSELSEGFVTGQWKTDDAVISAVNQKLKNRVKGRLARMERFVEAETVKGKDYLIAFLPIQDVSGKPAALFVQYLTDEYSGYHTRMKMIDISLFTILLAGLLYSIDNIQSRRIALQKNIELLSEKEQIILETMELNRSILHTSSIGILTYNASGQCVFANEAAAKIAGTSVAGMLSLNFHQLQSWKESGMYETALKALNTETEQETEAHVITTFGRDIWLNAKFSSFQSSGEKYLLMFTYDITESKHAEEKLRKSERRLRDSQKVAKIGSWRWDIVNNTLDWSDEAFRRFDKDPETFTPTVEYFVGLIHHEDREAVQRAIQASLENDAPYHIQPRIKNESGREWALEGFGKVERDAAGKPLRFSGTVQDVTERKNIEDVIRQSEIKYRSLVESLQEGIWAIDKDDITTFVNSRMAEMLGYIVDEMTGRSVFSFMDEHGIELCKENIERR